MIGRLNKIAKCLRERYPTSRLKVLSADRIKRLKEDYPKIPVLLVRFFEVVGAGRIGDSQYMVYDGFIKPDFIFDKKTAADLEGIVLVGDDFAGQHEAYDTRHRWRFGTVSGSGRFTPHTRYRNIVDLIQDWYCADE